MDPMGHVIVIYSLILMDSCLWLGFVALGSWGLCHNSGIAKRTSTINHQQSSERYCYKRFVVDDISPLIYRSF